MRISESRIRQIVREEARRALAEGMLGDGEAPRGVLRFDVSNIAGYMGWSTEALAAKIERLADERPLAVEFTGSEFDSEGVTCTVRGPQPALNQLVIALEAMIKPHTEDTDDDWGLGHEWL